MWLVCVPCIWSTACGMLKFKLKLVVFNEIKLHQK